jgi:5'(3')-deoxyribonucleotidase
MNKTLLLILFLPFLFFSCAKKNETLPRKTTGKINTISVIIDDQLWNGEIGDSIRNKFASPVIGLPQEEPLFTINQYPTKLMEGFMTDSRTIIVVKKENTSKFKIVKNQYASPQNVFHISGITSFDILKTLEENAPKIIQIIKETELAESQRIINQSLIDIKAIKTEFNVSLHIPFGYLYALKKPNFIWLKKEILSGNTSLLIYEVPLNSIKKDSNLIVNIIKMRDSIGNLYIRGTEPEARMITEEGYSPYLFKIKLNGKETFETKGTWELKNDFMSGPFINYAILDPGHNRILVLEGFCYSPSGEKRDLMHELESIIKSITILK